MSILSYRRPRVNRSTRPAVIRPVPATFAAGILEDDDNAWLDRYHAACEARYDAAETEWSNGGESLARDLVAAYRATDEPNAADDAWDAGFCLGREGVEASPIHPTHAERMAFRAGHERGEAIYHDERREEVEATIAAWEDAYGYDEHAVGCSHAG